MFEILFCLIWGQVWFVFHLSFIWHENVISFVEALERIAEWKHDYFSDSILFGRPDVELAPSSCCYHFSDAIVTLYHDYNRHLTNRRAFSWFKYAQCCKIAPTSSVFFVVLLDAAIRQYLFVVQMACSMLPYSQLKCYFNGTIGISLSSCWVNIGLGSLYKLCVALLFLCPMKKKRELKFIDG